MGCICLQLGGLISRDEYQNLAWNSVLLYRQRSTKEHWPGCPVGRRCTQKRSQTLGMRFRALMGILGKAVEISFAMRSGAGGYSISPTFRYYPTVDEDTAPAFCILKLVDDYFEFNFLRRFGSSSRLPAWELFAGTALKRLVGLFHGQTPKASPLDVTCENETLMHYAASVVSRSKTHIRSIAFEQRQQS